jgi:hypothetical protein
MASIVKANYIRKGNGKRIMAHLNYVQYRSHAHEEKKVDKEKGGLDLGVEDSRSLEPKVEAEERGEAKCAVATIVDERLNEKEKSGKARWFYDRRGEKTSRYFVDKEIRGLKRRDTIHRIVISPGRNDANVHSYVKEVMVSLGGAKGQDLVYYYPVHENTDHKHVHVVLLGRDLSGGEVRLDRLDLMRMRAFGDRYLERVHGQERTFDQQMEMYARRNGINVFFEKDRQKLLELLERPQKEKGVEERKAVEEFQIIDDDWKKLLAMEPKHEGGLDLGQSALHFVGRMSDYRSVLQNKAEKDLWEDIRENMPEKKDVADEKLAQIEEDRKSIFDEIARRTCPEDPGQMVERLAELLKREADEFFNPQMHEPKVDEKPLAEIDYSKVSADDMIVFGDVYTKYDSKEDLVELSRSLDAQEGREMPEEDQKKLWQWIYEKAMHGDDCFGQPPVIEREAEKEKEMTELADVSVNADPLIQSLVEAAQDSDERKGLDESVGRGKDVSEGEELALMSQIDAASLPVLSGEGREELSGLDELLSGADELLNSDDFSLDDVSGLSRLEEPEGRERGESSDEQSESRRRDDEHER